jgi:hypothetical protein
MRGGIAAAAALASALLTVGMAAAPAVAQSNDAPTRMTRPVPHLATPQALVSRNVQGYPKAVIDAFAKAPAIVVAPSGMTQPQKDEFGRTFRGTKDGYFARLTFANYDVIFNGTLSYVVPPASLKLTPRTTSNEVRKANGETDVTFSDFGGDYVIQFVCHKYDESTVGGCVSDADAIAFSKNIVPLGGGLE